MTAIDAAQGQSERSNDVAMSFMGERPGTFEFDDTANGPVLVARGAWTLESFAELSRSLSAQLNQNGAQIVADVSQIEHMDTSGAWLLVKLRNGLRTKGGDLLIEGLSADREVLFDEVQDSAHAVDNRAEPRFEQSALNKIGETTVAMVEDGSSKLDMLGHVVMGLGRLFRQPGQLRGISIVHHLDQSGLRAVPIIALMAFVIGAIVAQQSAYQLRYFGAEIFTVDLLGILVLRELGVLLTAVMVAGRSGSAFTAEIGSMKMREEIDALRVIGLSPTQVLVIPRVIALVIALPLLTVVADIFALFGGGLVSWLYAEISPQEFIARLREAVWLETLMVGFIKAPFMALVIAIIGCSEGFAVKGSAESLGRHTTASVVKAIFVVIVMDGLFAMFFASIGY